MAFAGLKKQINKANQVSGLKTDFSCLLDFRIWSVAEQNNIGHG